MATIGAWVIGGVFTVEGYAAAERQPNHEMPQVLHPRSTNKPLWRNSH